MSVLALAVGGRGLVDPGEPVLHADDEAFLRGRAAFETIRVYGGRPFRLEDHLERLRGSAERLALPDGDAAQFHPLVEDALGAVFPGGSVTGAPKISALDHIAALEPVGRGASMGALGTIRPNGDLELALTIRTFAVADGELHLWVGGGIVWDSEPRAEIEESWLKARPLLAAVGSAIPEAVLS